MLIRFSFSLYTKTRIKLINVFEREKKLSHIGSLGVKLVTWTQNVYYYSVFSVLFIKI